jgi:hypothetical protein
MSTENVFMYDVEHTDDQREFWQERLYSYITGKNTKDWKDEQRASRLEQELENDLQKYKSAIGEKPQNVNDEEWERVKKTRLYFVKRLRVMQYVIGSPVMNTQADVDEVEAKLDVAETAEDAAEIDPEDRPLDCSDEEWSEKKKKILEQNESSGNDEEERREREALLAKGVEDSKKAHEQKLAGESSVRALRTDVSKDIRDIYVKIIPILMRWWNTEPSKEDETQIAIANQNIEWRKRDKNGQIAPTEYQFRMKHIVKGLAECELSKNPGDTKALVRLVIAFTNLLRDHCLDWKMVAPKAIHTRLLRTLHSVQSTEVEKLTENFEDSYLQPTTEQKTLLERVSFMVPFIVSGLEEQSAFQLKVSIEQLKSLNEEIWNSNSSCGIKGLDHNVPVRELETCLGGGDLNLVAKLVKKMELLHIPGGEQFQKVLQRCSLSALNLPEIRNEVLGLSSEVEPSTLVEGLRGLSLGNMSDLAYSADIEQKTLGWGGNRSKFYINQYGPDHASVFRKESCHTASWGKDFPDDPPLLLQVSNSVNRNGEVLNGTGRKKWGAQHIRDIYGVAWQEDRALFPGEHERIEILNPDNHRDGLIWNSTYILVGWYDPATDSNGINEERKWETRATLRERYKKDADWKIYQCALKSQRKFDEWRRVENMKRDLVDDLQTKKIGTGTLNPGGPDGQDAVIDENEIEEARKKCDGELPRAPSKTGPNTRARKRAGRGRGVTTASDDFVRMELFHTLREKYTKAETIEIMDAMAT